MQISTDWHNLLLIILNQFVSQATQRSQEFTVFIDDQIQFLLQQVYIV